MRSDGSKIEVGDVGTGPDGVYGVVIAVDETKAGVQLVRVQRTMRSTFQDREFYVRVEAAWTDRGRADIRDGVEGW